jgi:hypothetical protein
MEPFDKGCTTVVVFSRDRAFQLDGMLRSFLMHCQDPDCVELFIIYKTTNELHDRQYNCLIQEYVGQNIRFIRERSFKDDLISLLVSTSQKRWRLKLNRLVVWLGDLFGHPFHLLAPLGRVKTIFFLVDDNIFVRPFELREIEDALESHTNAIGFSLRLGKNTTHCYPLDRPQALPEFVRVNERIYGFRWVGADADYGYPLEVSSSIYRSKDLLPLLFASPFDNPNGLEQQLSKRARVFRRITPVLLCYEVSVSFCNPINRVQTMLNNRAGNTQQYSSLGLAEMFDAGYRLDVQAYRDFVPASCHQEVELMVRKVG